MIGIVAVPAVDACAADDRGLVTCLHDMVDRRFNLPGEVPRQPVRGPIATVPIAPPIEDRATPPAAPPVAVAEPAPKLPQPPAGQGGPYIPPAPERVADLRPEVVESAPAPATMPAWTPPVVAPAPRQPAEMPSPVQEAEAPDAAVDPAPPVVELEPSLPAATPSPAIAAADPQPPEPPKPDPEPLVLAVTPEPEPVPEPEAMPQRIAPPSVATYQPPPPPRFPPPEQSAALPSAAPLAPGPAEMTVAAGPETPPAVERQPTVTAPVVLAPTIDAIELEGARSFVSGSGPAGAVMRLFADDEVIGESPVEEGRWLVETGPLLTSPKRELRIEAVDPDTGKSLGKTVITVEIELEPAGPTEPKPRPPAATPSDPEPQTPAEPEPTVPSSSPADEPEPPAAQPGPTQEPEAEPPVPEPGAVAPDEVPPTSEPAVDVESDPEPAAEPQPLPELAPKKPERETASVTILEAPGNSPSVTTLGPRRPAIVAEFETPRPRPTGQPVTVLKLVPFGDPVNGRFTGGKAIIRRGDTLWTLAHRYYGAGIHYRTIYDANRDQIRRPSRIFPGQIFDLPLVTND